MLLTSVVFTMLAFPSFAIAPGAGQAQMQNNMQEMQRNKQRIKQNQQNQQMIQRQQRQQHNQQGY